MSSTIVGCTDGSPIAHEALADGMAVLDLTDARIVLVTVAPMPDPMLVTGTGFAGGTVSEEEFDQIQRDDLAGAQSVIAEAAAALGIGGVETQVLMGDAGTAICDFALEIGATAIVAGSRGRGGLVRAVMGSVSDHLVRNAHCPVVVTAPKAD